MISPTLFLAGVGLFAIACLTFLVLFVVGVVRLAMFGHPETARWQALATRHGWSCDGPFRLSGGAGHRPWTLRADFDEDDNVGPLTFRHSLLDAPADEILETYVVTLAAAGFRRSEVPAPWDERGDTWRAPAPPERPAGTGPPWLDGRTRAAWLTAMRGMPSIAEVERLTLHVTSTWLELRADPVAPSLPLEEVERFVLLGLTLAEARHGGMDVGATWRASASSGAPGPPAV